MVPFLLLFLFARAWPFCCLEACCTPSNIFRRCSPPAPPLGLLGPPSGTLPASISRLNWLRPFCWIRSTVLAIASWISSTPRVSIILCAATQRLRSNCVSAEPAVPRSGFGLDTSQHATTHLGGRGGFGLDFVLGLEFGVLGSRVLFELIFGCRLKKVKVQVR